MWQKSNPCSDGASDLSSHDGNTSRMGEKVAWNHEGTDSCTRPWELEMDICPLCCWWLLRKKKKKALVRRRITISFENQIHIVRVIDAHKIGT